MTVISQPWCVPTKILELGDNEVHVWRAPLDMPEVSVERFYDTLAVDERERAELFLSGRDRRDFITARAVLRAILSRYLHIPPTEIRLDYTSNGKPFLSSSVKLSFNLSHSNRLALYAVTRNRLVGVDVEYMRENIGYEGISQHSFSTYECATLRALPPHVRKAAFYACWTRKEAFIKALGEGLSYPLDQFDVSLSLDQPAALLRTYLDPDDANRWTLCDVTPGPGYAGAVAAEGTNWRLLCWQWLPIAPN